MLRGLPPPTPPAQAGGAAIWLTGILAGAALLTAIYFWVALSWNYSTGERAGWTQKLSKKGWVCKTWEGELVMVSLPGSMPEKFYFTVRDDAVADQINASMGRRVSLHYEEKVGLPTSCFGDTRHFVVRVVRLDDAPNAPGAAAAAPAPLPIPAAPANPAMAR
jgi:hypothetical protein